MQRTTRARARRTNASSRRPVPPRTRVAQRSRDEAGLTLVEVIVAISLLGIFAIVFAPVLYTNLDISTRQATIAYASQQAATYIDDVRANATKTCGGLNSYTAGNRPTTQDGRSVTVKVSGAVVSGCPVAGGPSTATVTVTACEPINSSGSNPCAAGDRTLAVVSTRIMVQG